VCFDPPYNRCDSVPPFIYFIPCRLDRLLVLLDTGSSSSVRNTAAKQLAQLAAKSVSSDVAVEDDVKSIRQHALFRDPSAWAEMMAVVARVRGVLTGITL
jgi:hypothetical protein